MNPSEKERIAKLLKQSLPRVEEEDTQLGRDLWPTMLRRLQQPPASKAWFERGWFDRIWFDQGWFNEKWFNAKWFDWALGAAVIAWLVFFPAAIPVLLYHL
jgi:hypothetical protein